MRPSEFASRHALEKLIRPQNERQKALVRNATAIMAACRDYTEQDRTNALKGLVRQFERDDFESMLAAAIAWHRWRSASDGCGT